jgi:hypothetical protein
MDSLRGRLSYARADKKCWPGGAGEGWLRRGNMHRGGGERPGGGGGERQGSARCQWKRDWRRGDFGRVACTCFVGGC